MNICCSPDTPKPSEDSLWNSYEPNNLNDKVMMIWTPGNLNDIYSHFKAEIRDTFVSKIPKKYLI